MIESIRRQIEREENERADKKAEIQRLDDARSVLGTKAGRRLLHWIVYEVGGLQAIVAPEEQGRRVLASAVYHLMDTADPGIAEQIALDAREQRIADEAEITSAVADRSHEYE